MEPFPSFFLITTIHCGSPCFALGLPFISLMKRGHQQGFFTHRLMCFNMNASIPSFFYSRGQLLFLTYNSPTLLSSAHFLGFFELALQMKCLLFNMRPLQFSDDLLLLTRKCTESYIPCSHCSTTHPDLALFYFFIQSCSGLQGIQGNFVIPDSQLPYLITVLPSPTWNFSHQYAHVFS